MNSIEEKVVQLLKNNGLTISCAESCTGGLLSGTLVNVSGVSNVLAEAYVTYANESKERILGVDHKTLEEHGPVSEETAAEMAKGVCNVSSADVGLSTTGIAGPEGGTKEKPVGLVYIGYHHKDKTTVKKLNLSGDRQTIRNQAVKNVLELCYTCMKEEGLCE